MLQTNSAGMCSQCLSHTGPDPARSAHSSGSRLLHRGPSEASPGLHAPPRSKPLRLGYSGSPQRRRLSWACVLCPSQVRVAQVFGECKSKVLKQISLWRFASPIPAAQSSECTTGDRW